MRVLAVQEAAERLPGQCRDTTDVQLNTGLEEALDLRYIYGDCHQLIFAWFKYYYLWAAKAD